MPIDNYEQYKRVINQITGRLERERLVMSWRERQTQREGGGRETGRDRDWLCHGEGGIETGYVMERER